MSDSKNKRETERSEVRHKTAKIISGLFPGGSSVYETFTAIMQPLHKQRKDEWVKNVTLRLHKLEQEKRINLKDLAANEEFNTIITRATLLAMQTHIEEKRRALLAISVVIVPPISAILCQSFRGSLCHFRQVISRIFRPPLCHFP